MPWFICAFILIVLVSCKEELSFIPGTGTLQDCDETPIVDMNGTSWFNQGTVTVLTPGCRGAEPEEMLTSCPENWVVTKNENDPSLSKCARDFRLWSSAPAESD